MRSRKRKWLSALLAGGTLGTLLSVVTTSGMAEAATGPKPGGAVTVVEVGNGWPSLYTTAANGPGLIPQIPNAIYGELFEQNANEQIVPDLAQSWSFSNGNKTFTINLRHGVKFQDGTPFNATAVATNFNYLLLPANNADASSLAEISSAAAVGQYKVVLTLKYPYGPLIDSFISSAANWVPSPTALAKEGVTEFSQHPVGAGPFEVESNVASSQLVLKKFKGYWEAGHPYLNTLTYLNVPTDESAYAALESGEAQIVEGILTPALIKQAKARFQVQTIPGQQATDLVFNTTKPPFNNILAREAVIYTTKPGQILNVASAGLGKVTESPSGPGGVFSEPTVPGYLHYNLAKAKSLVNQLGGLSFSIFYGTDSAPVEAGAEALDNEFAAAGIKVTLNPIPPASSIQAYVTGNWTGTLTDGGGLDPDAGFGGLQVRFSSTGLFSGVRDATLDGMINQSASLVSSSARQAKIFAVYKYIATHAYADFLFVTPIYQMAQKNIGGAAASNSGAGPAPMVENIYVG